MPKASRYLEKRPEAACDTECYIDYWSIGFKNLATGRKVIIEKYAGLELDRVKIRKIMTKYRVYTFNGNGYDMLMISLALAGASNAQLKEASDNIIVRQMRSWKFMKHYELPDLPAFIDHIDLIEVAPGVKLSLKKYGARMNMQRLQELPIDPSEPVGAARRPMMRIYLGNDLDTTCELALRLREEIGTRSEISAEYGIDVRSKSDAQIAETLIRAEVEKVTGRKIEKPVVKTFSFKYEPPAFIKFKTPQLQQVLDVITATRFFVSAENPDDSKTYGVVRLPQPIKDLQIKIGSTDYKMGIGGLHSKEKRRSFEADEDTIIEDRDVRAYYPRIILGSGYVPVAVGPQFRPIFQRFVDLRDVYKAQAAKLKKLDPAKSMTYKKRSDTFKIVNNGLYGKLGSPYSIVYAPQLMISTTMTGQLSLLMLIEELELQKFTVISANTDGIVTVIPKERYGMFACIVFDWELATSFQTEALRYHGVYSRDVNSYIALPADYLTNPDAEVKRKGLFAKAGLQAKHDPTFDICSTAVVEFLMHGADIQTTIEACDDITQFVGVKQVGKVTMPDGKIITGGYDNDGNYLGKMVRWYYAEGEEGFIKKANGARVAGTTGATPCMDLPEEFPEDIDYGWYIREAYARLDDIGLSVRNPLLSGRQGYRAAVLPKQKTAHIIDLQTQRSLCGRSVKNVREPWEELHHVPTDMRTCKVCQEERGFVDEEVDQDAI
jgi:hypothetical protein